MNLKLFLMLKLENPIIVMGNFIGGYNMKINKIGNSQIPRKSNIQKDEVKNVKDADRKVSPSSSRINIQSTLTSQIAENYYRAAVAYERVKNYNSAISAYEKANILNPNPSTAEAIDIAKLRKFAEAIKSKAKK